MIISERINKTKIANNLKTYNNGRQAHTNFENPSGYKVHSLYILNMLNTVYVMQKQTTVIERSLECLIISSYL